MHPRTRALQVLTCAAYRHHGGCEPRSLTRILGRFSVKLDATDRDGTIRKGQGMEIKVGPENMEIYDEEIEAMLDAEMELDAFNDDLNNNSSLGADTAATAVREAPRAFKPTASAVSR